MGAKDIYKTVSMSNICHYYSQSFLNKQVYVSVEEKLRFYKYLKAHIIQPCKKYMRQTLVFMSNSAIRKNFNFYFSAVFC